MATTKIWPVHDSLKRLVDYAGNPEKTEYSDLRQALHYAADPEKVSGEERMFFVTGINCDAGSAYEQMAEELGIDGCRCHLNAPTNQIQKEYLNSSVFAVSSRFEGLSMALLEAAACGLPIVSFACPCGPRDLITDGVDGLLVEKENVDALADSLLQVMNSPEIRESMSSAILKKAELFQIDHIAMQWQQLFESL